MSTVIVKKSDRTGKWIKGRPTSGLVFTLGFDDLERMLKHVRRVRDDEQVVQYEIDENGINVYLGPAEEV